jgi:hypothetical protein
MTHGTTSISLVGGDSVNEVPTGGSRTRFDDEAALSAWTRLARSVQLAPFMETSSIINVFNRSLPLVQ